MKKTLTINNINKYWLSKNLKDYIKNNKTCLFAFSIDKKDFDILNNKNFDNCYVYTIKEYFYSLNKVKIWYYINFINKKNYTSFYEFNKDFWKFINSYYFYKLKDFYKEKRYYEYNNYYIDYTYNNKFYKEYYNN